MRKVLLFLCLIGLNLTAVLAQGEKPLAPGDWVIALKHPLKIHTAQGANTPVSGVIPRGTRSRVVVAKDDWFYLADNAYGWVPASSDNQPTLARYTPEELDNIINQATAKINTTPNDVDDLAIRCVAYSTKRDFEKALADCDAAIQQSPDNGLIYDYRAKVYLDKGDFKEAATDVDKATGFGVNWAATFNREGVIYDHMTLTQGALIEFEGAAQIEPTFGLAYLNAAAMTQNLGKNDQALQYYDQALLHDPYLSLVYWGRGNLYKKQGDLQAALNEFNKGIELDPFNSDLFIARGLLYGDKMRDYQKAQADLIHATELDPENSYAFSALGVNYMFLGQLEPAVDSLKKAIDLYSKNLDGYYNLAYVYAITGRYPGAIEAYTHVTEIGDRYDYSILLYRSQVYIALNDYANAEADINKYFPCPKCRADFLTLANFVRGESRLYQGRYDEALQDYRQAFITYPEFASAYATYGAGYWTTPLRQKLIPDLQAQIAQQPSAKLHRDLAILYMEYGQWQNAVASFREALKLEPNPQLQRFVDQFETLIQ